MPTTVEEIDAALSETPTGGGTTLDEIDAALADVTPKTDLSSAREFAADMPPEAGAPVAASGDPGLVEQFNDWNTLLAQKISSPIDSAGEAASFVADSLLGSATPAPVKADPKEEEARIASETHDLLRESFGKDATRAATVANLAAKTGISTRYINENYDKIKASWEASNFDAARWIRENPDEANLVLQRPDLRNFVREKETLTIVDKGFRAAGELYMTGFGREALGSVADNPLLALVPPIAVPAAVVRSVDKLASDEDFGARLEAAVTPQDVEVVADARAREGKEAGALGKFKMTLQDRLNASRAGLVGAKIAALEIAHEVNGGEPPNIAHLEREYANLSALSAPRNYLTETSGVIDPYAVATADIAGTTLEMALGAAPLALAGASLGPGGATAGALMGAVIGPAPGMYGGAYMEYRNIRLADGSFLSKRAALAGAYLETAVQLGTEAASFGTTTSAFRSLLRDLPAGAGKSAVRNYIAKKLATDKAWGARLVATVEVGKKAVFNTLGESGEEIVSGIGTGVANHLVREVDANGIQALGGMGLAEERADAEAIFRRAIEAGAAAAKGSILPGAVTAGATGPAELREFFAERARIEAMSNQAVEAIVGAADTPLAIAAPSIPVGKVSTSLAAYTGYETTSLFMDAAKIATVLNQDEVRRELGDEEADALREAVARGDYYEIPYENVAKWKSTTFFERIREHLTGIPGVASIADRVEIDRRNAEVEKANVELYKAENDPKPLRGEEKFTAALEQQLRDAFGMSLADARVELAPLRGFVRSMASRFPNPENIFSGYSISIVRDGLKAHGIDFPKITTNKGEAPAAPAVETPAAAAVATEAPPSAAPTPAPVAEAPKVDTAAVLASAPIVRNFAEAVRIAAPSLDESDAIARSMDFVDRVIRGDKVTPLSDPFEMALASLMADSPKVVRERLRAWVQSVSKKPSMPRNEARAKLVDSSAFGKTSDGATTLSGISLSTPTNLKFNLANRKHYEPVRMYLLDRSARGLLLRDYVTDINTGAYNVRGFKELPVDPQRPMLAFFAIEGTKAINDIVGHEALDAALRAGARILQKQDVPWVAKLGGDIVASVKDEAEARELAAKVRAAFPSKKFGINYGLAKHDPTVDLRATMDVAGDDARARRDALNAEGKGVVFSTRGDLPAAFLPLDDSGLRRQNKIVKDELTQNDKFDIDKDIEKLFAEEVRSTIEKDDLAIHPSAFELAPEIKKAFGGKGTEDLIGDIVEDEGSGIGSLDSFVIRERTGGFKAYSSIDLAFLRDLNTMFGRIPTDELLDAFGAIIDRLIGDNGMVVRLHGDEYAIGSDVLTEEELQSALLGIRAEMETQMFALPLMGDNGTPSGEYVVQDGLYFGAGVGSSYKEADGPTRLGADKIAEKARVGSKSRPKKITEKDLEQIKKGFKLLNPSRQEADLADAEVALEEAKKVLDKKRGTKGEAAARAKVEKAEKEASTARTAVEKLRESIEAERKAAAEKEGNEYNEDTGLVSKDDGSGFGLGGTGRLVLPIGAPGGIAGGRIQRGRARRSVQGLRGEDGETRVGEAGREDGPAPVGAEEVTTLASEKDGKKRGFVTKTDKSFSITLTDKADLSTFLHESAHVFFWLLQDLAARPDAPQSVRDDYARAVDWIGVKPGEVASREKLEVFARGFEAYLREGKEPAKTLKGAFMRFGVWLKGIYRNADDLDVELSDEVRGIFDRLIATDDQIRAQAEEAQNRRLFLSPEDGGMTEEEFDRYVKESDAEIISAARRAEIATLREQKRVLEDWWRKERAAMKKIAGIQYDALPEVVANRTMRGYSVGVDGKLVAGPTRIPLDADEVAKILGVKVAPDSVFTSVTDGMKADDAAVIFGFPTGEALVKAVAGREERDAYVERVADSLMNAKYPSMADDMRVLEEKVREAIAEAGSPAWRMKELDKVRARLGLDAIPEDVLKASAKAIVAGKRVRDLDVERATRAERKAAVDAGKALGYAKAIQQQEKKGEDGKPAPMSAKARKAWAAVEKAKRSQVLNYFVMREMRAARKELGKFATAINRAQNETTRSRIAMVRNDSNVPVLLNGIDALLTKMRETRDGPPLDVASIYDELVRLEAPVDESDRESFSRMDEALSALGEEAWDNLTYEQSLELRRFFVMLLTNAMNESKAIRNGKEVDLQNLKDALFAEARAASTKPWVRKERAAMTLKERIADKFDSRDAELKKVSEMMVKIGGSEKSAWYESIFLPVADALAAETDLRKKVNVKIIDAFRKIPRSFDFRKPVDGKALFPNHRIEGDVQVAPPSTVGEILMLLINTGTESSRGRLLTGRNITLDEVIAAADKHLTPETVEWAKTMLEQVGSLWPEVKALEERENGEAPPEQKPVTTTTKHGSISGYFPAVYVPLITRVGTKQSTEEFVEKGFLRPSTSKSHTHRRVEGFTAAISLDPVTIVSHIDKVTHDLSHREAVKSVARLLRDQQVKDAILGVLGPHKYEKIERWLKDIGLGVGAGIDQHARVQSWLTAASRSWLIWRSMALTLTTPLGDISNIPRSVIATKLKSKYLGFALAKTPAGIRRDYARMLDLSGQMRSRHDTVERTLRKHIGEMTSSPVYRHPIVRGIMDSDNWFLTLRLSDILTTTPIWTARFQQGMDEHGDRERAIRDADRTIEKIFPSSKTVHASAIMRDKSAASALLVFHSYWNTEYNVIAPLFEQVLGEKTVPDKAKAFAIMLAYMTAAQVFGEIASGRGAEEDESWAAWYARKMVAFTMSIDPVGGEVASMVESLIMDRRPNARSMGPAYVVSELTKGIRNALASDNPTDALTAVIGTLAPYQAIRTARFASEASASNAPPSALRAASGAIYGERERQGANPITVANEIYGAVDAKLKKVRQAQTKKEE